MAQETSVRLRPDRTRQRRDKQRIELSLFRLPQLVHLVFVLSTDFPPLFNNSGSDVPVSAHSHYGCADEINSEPESRSPRHRDGLKTRKTVYQESQARQTPTRGGRKSIL